VQSFSKDILFTQEQVEQAKANDNLKNLLGAAESILSTYSIPWGEVHSTNQISALRWDLSAAVDKLDAEEWDFNGQRILELSLKGKVSKRLKHEGELQDYLKKSDVVGPSGGMKTSAVLDAARP
jgi:hypothetical protein